MRVVGIDFSSHAVDAVSLDADDDLAPRWERWDLVGSDAFERARDVANSMPGRASAYWDDVIAVGIEHPAGKFGVPEMMRMQGAILACIPRWVLVQPLPPAKWRVLNGLKGNCAKSAVRVCSEAHLTLARAPENVTVIFTSSDEHCGWSADAHDAHLIARATQQLLAQEKAA